MTEGIGWRRRLLGAGGGLVIAVVVVPGLVYGLNHVTSPLGGFTLGTIVLGFLSIVMVSIGKNRAPGRRWVLSLWPYQVGSHPLRVRTDADVIDDWRRLGQRDGALRDAWACRHRRCDRKVYRGEVDGQEYLLSTHIADQPWFRWALGYFIVFGEDPPKPMVTQSSDSTEARVAPLQ